MQTQLAHWPRLAPSGHSSSGCTTAKGQKLLRFRLKSGAALDALSSYDWANWHTAFSSGLRTCDTGSSADPRQAIFSGLI